METVENVRRSPQSGRRTRATGKVAGAAAATGFFVQAGRARAAISSGRAELGPPDSGGRAGGVTRTARLRLRVSKTLPIVVLDESKKPTINNR